MEPENTIKENESFLLYIYNKTKENALICYPIGEDNLILKKSEGKFLADPDNLSKVKKLVSPEFLLQYFK